MRFRVKKPARRFETLPLAQVPHENDEGRAAHKVPKKDEPYAIPVMSEVEVRSPKRKPGH